MKRNKRSKPRPKHTLNNEINYQEIRLVGNNVEQGVYSKREAISIAESLGMDLILINENQKPPICKIEDYSKMLYLEKKRKKDLNKKSKISKVELKEIRLSPNIGKGDIEHKIKKATEFIQNNNKVKFTLQFKGRQMMHKEKGELLILQIVKSLEDICIPESLPVLQGRRMTITVKPKQR